MTLRLRSKEPERTSTTVSGRNIPGRGEELMPRPKGRMYLKDRKKAKEAGILRPRGRIIQNDATQACGGQAVPGSVS